jgi:hypothetical protein
MVGRPMSSNDRSLLGIKRIAADHVPFCRKIEQRKRA